MRVRTALSGSVTWGLVVPVVVLAGCAKHADFMEIRDQLSTISRTQDQDHQRVDTVMRRVEAMERSKDTEATKPRIDDLGARFQRMEQRLAKLEETVSQLSGKLDASVEPRTSKPTKPAQPADAMATASGITPTSAFNLAYND